MKRLFYSFAALAAASMLFLACNPDMTDDEKDQAADEFSKLALAGEYGVMNITGTDEDGTDSPLFGDLATYVDEDGRPVTIMVLSLYGSYYMAPNRVWKDISISGFWDVVDGELQLRNSPDAEVRPADRYKVVSAEDGYLILERGPITYTLKRLEDADRCPQLQSVEFAHNLANDGKLYIDPRIELNAGGTYKLELKYDPEDYEPYGDVSWESSNPEVATVVDGYLRPADGVTSGETTITVSCDYVEASITVVLQVVN